MDILMWHKYNKECAHENAYELTPYLVEDKNAPVVIVCPGGGYRMVAAFIEGHPVAEFFQSQGYNAFVLRYHVKEKAHYPQPLEDIADGSGGFQHDHSCRKRRPVASLPVGQSGLVCKRDRQREYRQCRHVLQ